MEYKEPKFKINISGRNVQIALDMEGHGCQPIKGINRKPYEIGSILRPFKFMIR